MSLSPQLFGQMTHLLKGVCQGRLGLVLEVRSNFRSSVVWVKTFYSLLGWL